jgi:hypothetical protein
MSLGGGKMKFTAYIPFVFFSILVITLVGCDRPSVRQAAMVYDVDEEASDTVLDSVQSALDSVALENTVKLFYMWDNEFCDKGESQMQRLSEFLTRHPELDTDGLNRFKFDTIEEAKIFYDVVEGYYKLRRVDLPFIDEKYVAHFHPSCYPMHW